MERRSWSSSTARRLKGTSVEIPGRKLERGENADPKAAALRELKKKLAATADLELFYGFYSAIGFVMSESNFWVRPT